MKQLLMAVLAVALFGSGCAKSRKPIVVGSKNSTEQNVLGEMIAQHLERRLQVPVTRRLSQGNTETLYAALIGGEISVYPEYTGLIETIILKEPPDADAAVVHERARTEMLRVAQSELFPTLGFDNPPTVVVRASAAPKKPTLSAAAAGTTQWKMAVSFDFQQRRSGLSSLNTYHLPMAASLRTMDEKQLFPSMEKGDLVNMIVATATDGHLTSDTWRTLADDMHVFPVEQPCILARQDVLNLEPQMRAALDEFSGKITQDLMRKWNAMVDVDKKPVAEVAAEGLNSLGLK